YTTVIIHLAVLVILLGARLGGSIRAEESFILDFTRQEEMEKLLQQAAALQREAELKEAVSRKLEEQLKNTTSPVRNVTVDRSELKDDRGTDAKQLYEDAERLAKDLKGGFTLPDEDDVSIPSKKDKKDKKEEKSSYKGPSVVSWTLKDRKASKLPIPAYRCIGGGEVTVLIKVDNQGYVTEAKVDDSCSSPDGCLRSFATRAARMSRFSIKADAPARQEGNIVYQFIAQ
ncbi:MAG: hypothetical protein J5764_04680, partial [Bacteroidales bacterium]|nr:hypothetical protein [Bacteroidales bacterium]